MANELLIPVKYVVDASDLDKAARQLGVVAKEEKELADEMKDVEDAAKAQAKALKKAGESGEQAAKGASKQYNILGNTIGNLGNIIAGAFALDRILAFGQKVIDVTATFQRLTAVLTTSLGSKSAAENALARIQQFAAETPYSVEQVTASFVKLAARGFQPTTAELKKLGDLAASTGKDFDQLTEALLDAQTGEFERLKEFGITARSEGDKVKFTFGETTTEVQKTNEAIKDYVLSLGDLEQVSGSAAAISETLGGKINNLGDTFDQFFVTIGEGSSGVLTTLIDQLNKIVTNATKIIDPIGTATKEAVANVSNFEAAISKSLTNLIDKTKTEGGDVEGAVAGQVAKVRAKIVSQLSGAQQALDDVQAKVDNIPKALQAFGLPKALETQLANSTARVKFLQAEMQTLDATAKKVLKQDAAADAAKAKAAAEAAKKAKEDADKARKEAFKNRQKDDFEGAPGLGGKFFTNQLDDLVKQGDKILKQDADLFDKQKDQALKASKDRVKIFEDEQAEKDRLREEAEAREEARIQAGVEFGIFAANAYTEYRAAQLDVQLQNLNAYYEREISLTGDNTVARAQLEKEYQLKKAELQTKQAQNEKNQALFNIAVQGAQSIVAASPDIILMAFAATTAAIQAALVAARPIPKFAKGTRSVMGGMEGTDSVLAMLMPGERVITTEKNRALSPAFDALTNSKRSPAFLNNALLEIEKYGMFTPPMLSVNGASGEGSELISELRDLKRIMGGLPIEQHTFDERGYTRAIQKGSSRIIKLHKRYGY